MSKAKYYRQEAENSFVNAESSLSSMYLEARVVDTNIRGGKSVVHYLEGHLAAKFSTTRLAFRDEHTPPVVMGSVNINVFPTQTAGHKH